MRSGSLPIRFMSKFAATVVVAICVLTGYAMPGWAAPREIAITATTTTLAVNPSGSLVAGERITLTATVAAVSGTVVPTGSVTFADPKGGSVTEPLDSTGKAVYSGVVPPGGTYSVFAAYNGAAGFGRSESATITKTVGSASFSELTVSGTAVVFDPDSVLTPSELASLSVNYTGGTLSATPAVKALSFAASAGQTISISASGLINCCNSTPNSPPDGYLPDVDIASLGSISGYGGPGFALLAVFTNGSPTGPAPASYDYSGGTGASSFAPVLNQVFYLGDGLTGTGSGSVQSFVVPGDATELWLGVADTLEYGLGSPSGYGDNTGSFTVSGALASSEVAAQVKQRGEPRQVR